MKTVNICEAKTRLSALVEEAIGGEDAIIAKAGKALVRLVPLNKGAPNSGSVF
jgi:antitoxin (DNA-binding transcriptional repressor) of toxin-antitoxin stability system